MIIVHKDGINIGAKYVHVAVFLELDENDPAEYTLGVGPNIDTEKIANEALQDSDCFTPKLFGIFADDIKSYIDVYSDDSYDYLTIDDMLNNSDTDDYKKWLESHDELIDCITNVEYNNKYYKCYIQVYVNK